MGLVTTTYPNDHETGWLTVITHPCRWARSARPPDTESSAWTARWAVLHPESDAL